MQMSEATEVVQVVVAENSNKRLADGWKLLAVMSAGNGDDSGRTFVWYVLGKPAAKAKGEFRAG